MFWGCFGGPEKGPCLFREEWGSIKPQKYCEKIVPLIDGTASMRPWLSVMQDNAPTHTAANTLEARARGSLNRFSGRATRLILTQLKLFVIG
ncbi:Bgt-51507 [Blumeria graminis f. sp. tritici]|uniref:Bgt-51507 n=1 Tax=Blumeria graminis f. sp. tritici TaxID=62690 RepID=A0A9X9MFU2_BLUGR|nr:Bgt-51507 [Blumeria graminis f. sp. tritici]